MGTFWGPKNWKRSPNGDPLGSSGIGRTIAWACQYFSVDTCQYLRKCCQILATEAWLLSVWFGVTCRAMFPHPPWWQKKFRRGNGPNSTSRRARDSPNSSKRSSLRGPQVPQQSPNSQNCFWGSTAPIKMSWYRRPRAVLWTPAENACFGPLKILKTSRLWAQCVGG